jgi:hypothetical protein
MPATELRIHLGDALKALEEEDIVVEKGGVPIAMLVRYGPEAKAMSEAATGYERALSKRAEAGSWERALSAMERGWAGISAEELTANIYRWRDEGATTRRFGPEMDEAEERGDGGSTVSGRQRYLQQGAPRQTRIADERAEWDVSGGTGD